MRFGRWLELIQQYGPLVGLLLVFIYWQARRIERLLDKNAKIYEAEIERMAKVQNRFLNQLLGPQPSSAGAPSIEAIKEASERLGEERTKPEGGNDG